MVAAGRRGELGYRDSVDLGIVRVHAVELFLGRRLDHLADPHRIARFVGSQTQAEGLRVGDDEEHAAPGDVDGDRAEFRYLDLGVEVYREGRHVFEGDVLDLAVPDFGPDLDQAGGCLEHQFGHRLLGLDHAGLDQDRGDGDGVGAGHRRVLDLLHDHIAGDRFGAGWGQD